MAGNAKFVGVVKAMLRRFSRFTIWLLLSHIHTHTSHTHTSHTTHIHRSFGGEVSWESSEGPGSTYAESDEKITHHVVDRPSQKHRYLSR